MNERRLLLLILVCYASLIMVMLFIGNAGH